MEDCIKKIGFDVSLVDKELQRYHDNSTEVDYLVNLESVVWDVADDVDDALIALENHIEKHQGKKNFGKPNRGRVIDTKVFDFINRRAKKAKNELSQKILYCIRDLTLNRTFFEADEEFEHWMNELSEFQQYLAFEIEKREKLLSQRIERKIKKLYWMGSEEALIDMFEQFKSKEFWEYEGDTKNAITLHFIIDKREAIPIKSELPFQKINWLFELNDLAKWYKVMIEENFIIHDTSIKNILITSHFLIRGKQIESEKFGDRYRQLKSKATYQTHKALNNFLKDIPKNN